MYCAACGHNNRPERMFCTKCGIRLSHACAACGASNEADENFCGRCGTALGWRTGTVAAEGDRSVSVPAGQRRQLTVLFSDVVGSTALSGRLDPEDWQAVVGEYQRTAAAAVGAYGGHVAKYLGDGVLVYFGYPEAHEDDAERGVRAALALLDGISALNGRLDRVRLAVRVGIHTGPVVIAEDGDVFGEVPNVAARVQGAAAPDTVEISGATQRLVAGLFVLEGHGPQSLKGVHEPVDLFRVIRPSGLRGRLATSPRLTPFVGREPERELLRERFAQAAAGEGQVVLITGEAGIGKSRLAHLLEEEPPEGAHIWLESSTAPYFTNTPFYAVRELLVRLTHGGSAQPREASIGELVAVIEHAGLNPVEVVPLVAPIIDLAVSPEYPRIVAAADVVRKRLLAVLASLLVGVARRQPMIILLEDLHWADPSTLDLQALLVDAAADVPLLLLYTARPEFRAPWPLAAHHTQLTLNRLSKRVVREIVTNVAGRVALSAGVVEELVSRTDGVPLFVEELTKAVVESGQEGSREIPATLADSLVARLDRLGSAKEIAQVAAVLGRDFSARLLEAVHPAPDLHASLDQLVDAELLYRRGVPPDVDYTFKHALVQQAAYDTLLRSRRRQLHERAAHVLNETFRDVAQRQPEVLARHLTNAGAGGPAVDAWLRAGEEALARGAPNEAERHLQHGLEVLWTLPEGGARDEREFNLHLPLGLARLMAKGYGSPAAAEAYARAQMLGERLGQPAQVAMLLLGQWASTMSRDGAGAARPLAVQMLTTVERAGLAPFRAWAHFAAGLTSYHAADLAAARAHASQALEDETPAAPAPLDPRIAALGLATFTAWQLGLPDTARAYASESLQRAQRAADRAWAEHMAADLCTRCLDPVGTLKHADATLAACREEASPAHEAFATILRGWALAQTEIAEGLPLLRAGIERFLQTGQRHSLEFHLGLLAEVEAQAGNLDQALAILADAVGAVPGEEVYRADTLSRRAELLARRGADPLDVEAMFRDALGVARRQGARSFELRASIRFARWLGDQKRSDEAVAILLPVYDSFTGGFDTGDVVAARTLLSGLRHSRP
jgi:class 3 adenylate cyclase